MAYVVLEIDRSRFALANKLTETRPLSAEVAKEMKKLSDDLGHLRRQLGIGGGWVDERVGEFNVESWMLCLKPQRLTKRPSQPAGRSDV